MVEEDYVTMRLAYKIPCVCQMWRICTGNIRLVSIVRPINRSIDDDQCVNEPGESIKYQSNDYD